MNNIRYGKITASDEEVYDACRAASIHDKIEEFADGRSPDPPAPSANMN
jgi:ABC-type multidrug transport system fused ATPase/permease subunit